MYAHTLVVNMKKYDHLISVVCANIIKCIVYIVMPMPGNGEKACVTSVEMSVCYYISCCISYGRNEITIIL